MILIVNNGKTQKSSENITQLTGEKIPGDLDGWKYFGTNPNDLLKLSYKQLSERSTTLYHTYAPISAAINKTDIRSLIKDGAIKEKPRKGTSKSIARKIKNQKNKTRDEKNDTEIISSSTNKPEVLAEVV